METGSIQIIQEEGKAPSVEALLTNGNLWMQKWQMARFFNVFSQKIEMNLRSIFREHLKKKDKPRNYKIVWASPLCCN
jgi:hypothetical protein